MSELKKRTAINIGFNGVAVLFVTAIQFLSNIILGRHLLPADYGIVGFSIIFINFVAQFSDFGIASALIQKTDTDEGALYTGFTLKLLFSVLAFVVLFAIAPVSKFFTAKNEVVAAIRLLSFGFLISVFVFLPQVTLTRELRYKQLSYPQILGAAAGACCAVGLAYSGFGFWSIITGSIIQAVTIAIVLNFIQPIRIHFRLEKDRARHLLSFGSHLFVPGIIAFLIFNVDNFAIGALKNEEQLGYYIIAFNWGSLICGLLANIVHQVLFPTFSKFQHDLSAVKKAYLESMKYVALLTVPFNLFLAVLGKEFLYHILGGNTERWLPALATLQVLCIYGLFRALLEPIANVITGIGKPRLFIKTSLLVAALQLTFLFPALKFGGITSVAIVVTLSYVSQYLICVRILKEEINVGVAEVWDTVRPALLAFFFSLPAILFIKNTFDSSIPLIVIEILTGCACYLFFYGFLTKWTILKEIKAFTR